MAALLAAAMTAPAAHSAASLSPGFRAELRDLSAAARTSALVHFEGGTARQRRALLESRGLAVEGELRSVDVIAVRGPIGAIARLAAHRWVSHLEDNAPMSLLGDTSIWASRVGPIRNAVSGGPYRAADGSVLDGAGIGVAVIDSGVDASHPDLINRVATNFLLPVGADQGRGSHTDVTSGHGTHVSGIVAGDGTASQGTYTGVAPGSSLHVFASSTGPTNRFFGGLGLEEVYLRTDRYSPRIRVLNNSWGLAGAPYNPDGAVEKIIRKIVVERGIVVVFSGGNEGGDGSADMTTNFCKDATPGVICAAMYDDGDTGSRDLALHRASSRGLGGAPDTYPDISAPGAGITSPFKPGSGAQYPLDIQPNPGWLPWYANASGTSMAAPHIAGIAALMLQARPTLSPAEVEDILLDTAHKFKTGGAYEPDPQNPGGTTSFDKGAGLIDAQAALRDPRVGVEGDGTPSPTTLATGDGGDYSGPGAADLVGIAAKPSATGVTFEITVRDAEDRPPEWVSFRVGLLVDGKRRKTLWVNLEPDGGVTPDSAESPDDPLTAEAASATRDGNTISFFVPHSELGDPPPGAPVHNVWAGAWIVALQDVVPSPNEESPARAEVVSDPTFLKPLYAQPFTIGR